MHLNIEIYRGNDKIYVASCPELDIFVNAPTQEEVITKIKTDINMLLESTKKSVDTSEDIDYSYHYYSSGYPQIH